MVSDFFRGLFDSGQPDWNTAPPAPDETSEFEARIPSRTSGMWFGARFDLTVSWNGAAATARTRALARVQREVIRTASATSAHYDLGDRGRAATEVACALTEREDFGQREVRQVTVRVALSADPEDLALERERERAGHRDQISAELHRARMDRVAELRRDVLTDPLTARVWWFEQHQDRWSELAGAGAALDQLIIAPAAGGGVDPTETADPVPAADPLLDAFLEGLDEWEVKSALHRLTDMMEGLERHDLAEALRRRWSGN